MSRYRPPAPKSSPYITADGYHMLCEEMDDLLSRRRGVVVHLAAAAAEGDRSENAEYIYRKKQLREIDRRLGYLQRRLPTLNVVKGSPDNRSKVVFGAWVTLCDEADVQVRYRIVGADEFDAAKNWISVDAPLARALIGKCVDDEVSVTTPNGNVTYHVIAVEYEPHC